MACCAPDVQCAEDDSSTIVDISKFCPEVSIVLDCLDAENNSDSCGCTTKVNCQCVALNEPMALQLQITPNNGDCPTGAITVKWYINDELIATTDYPSVDDVVPGLFQADEEGKYVVKVEVTNCCCTCEATAEIFVGPPVKLTRKECKIFNIMDVIDYSGYAYPLRAVIEIRDIEDNLLTTFTTDDYLGGLEGLNFSLPNDGIYKVSYKVIYTDGPNNGDSVTSYNYTLYELCTILDCYAKLALNLICPATSACPPLGFDNPDIDGIAEKVNRLTMLIIPFFASLAIQYNKTYGLLYFDEQYLATYKNHRMFIDAILKLCAKCGIDTTKSGNCGCP